MLRGAAPAIVAALAAIAATDAQATESRVPLGKASIAYENTNWRTAPSDANTVTFTCIASDCAGQPHVFVSLSSVREISAELANARRDGRIIPDDGVPPLPFDARSYWSGCRAKDEPILFAGGQLNDQVYRFTTSITNGCNYSPPLPASRFLELLRGLEY